MARVCVFDVNETLLDLTALDKPFARAFGEAGVRQFWFAQLIQSALVATVTDAYADFGTLGGAALDMMAAPGRYVIQRGSGADSWRNANAAGAPRGRREPGASQRCWAAPGCAYQLDARRRHGSAHACRPGWLF
jgi:hypothetical protein